jgi:drug/metabolite transporter (DMT)-like permease
MPMTALSRSILYAVTVLIWGSTWYAIEMQLGVVNPVVSIAHRFALAGLVVLLGLVLSGRFRPIARRHQKFLFLQGLLLFSGNYIFIYSGTASLPSGLVSVVFSMMVITNMLAGRIFLALPLSWHVGFSGLVGMVGIGVIFAPEIQAFTLKDESLNAMILCFIGTCLASLGNIVAARNMRERLPPLQSNMVGMLYGAASLYAVSLVMGYPITVDWSAEYLGSLLYLSLVGSVAAFWFYVTLIGEVGPSKASYIALLTPIVALTISALFEGYQWTLYATIGTVLVLGGNYLAMGRN